MKKIMLIGFCGLLLSACSSPDKPAVITNDTLSDSVAVSPKLKELNESSGDLVKESEVLNKKADSLLNNI